MRSNFRLNIVQIKWLRTTYYGRKLQLLDCQTFQSWSPRLRSNFKI